ncbi:tetratricopeptide repeat protein [Candidatus Parcubacteria bacterium]|nr:tetratricopeptide repeat protein [Candidatus Parcubacteria bacterium]
MEPEHTSFSSPVRGDELTADKVVKWSILAVVLLIPLFFIPTSIASFQFAKVLLLYAGIIIAFCACIIARLKDGVLRVMPHYLFAALAAIPVTMAISAVLSRSKVSSIIGQGFEVGTLAFMTACAALAFFVSYFFATKRTAVYAYLAFLIPVPIVALYQLIRLFAGGSALSFGVLTNPTSTLIGGWNDLGIYFGVVALFCFISLELLSLDRPLKIAFGVVLGVSLFFLSIVNFTIVWYILAGFALIFFVYNFSFNKSRAYEEFSSGDTTTRRTVPVISLVVLLISVIFILLRGNLYTATADLFNTPVLQRLVVSNVEVRPSWSSTYDIAKNSLRQDPIFGVGPNRFVNEWLESKPQPVNSTIFWGTDFNYGIGLIPTFIITTGLLGTLAWLVFFALFLYMGFRALFTKMQDPFSSYLTVSSFILALYLWVFTVLYVPSAPLLVLTFFFTGMFMASLVENKLVPMRSISFLRDPRMSFASVLVFIVLLLGMLVTSYAIGRRFIASLYFNRALAEANVSGNLERSESFLLRSVQLSNQDQFYRTLSELSLIRINQLLSQQNISQTVLENQFRALLATAQNAAQAAVNLDVTNYQNWLALGRAYESVVPFKVPGAYEKALESYNEARKLNPRSPAIPLVMARLDVANNNIPKAKEHIGEALQLKNDYTDAIFFLSQIQVNEGDIKSAIQSVEAAAFLNPNNPGVYFQLGLLRYQDKNYTAAASAFEQAVVLVPDYANAKYFLGLSYDNMNRTQDAIKQFEELKASNPDNAEVNLILTNLKAGRDAFANVRPPLDNKPESRSNPPLKETKPESETDDR